MSKAKKNTNEAIEIEYGFLAVKTKTGEHVVQVLKDSDVPEPATINDVYATCETICRNIQTQNIAETISKAMALAAQAQEKKGIVVPK